MKYKREYNMEFLDNINNIKSGIYKITCLISNKKTGIFKVYIGSSDCLSRREYDHFNVLNLNKHPNRYLQFAYKKYNRENFKFEIVEYVEDLEKLIEREQFYINEYIIIDKKDRRVIDHNRCYNISPTAGSNKGVKHTKESRKNMSNSKLGELNSFYGKIHSKESLEQMSNSKLGRLNPNYGRVHSKETLEKMGKKVINITTGKIFNGIKEASKYYNIDDSSICKVCKGKAKTSGGYEWSYVDKKDLEKVALHIVEEKIHATKNIINLTTNKEFKSIAEASNFYKISPHNISTVCKGKRKTAGGFKWSYCNKDNKVEV